MKDVLNISLIIPTMNRPKALIRTLISIFSFEYIPEEILIIDQSDEDSPFNGEMLNKDLNTNCIKVIRQTQPSLTKARNRGLVEVKNNFVMFLDDDIDFFEDTLINAFNRIIESNVALIAVKDVNLKPSARKISYLFFRKSYFKRNIGHVSMSMLGQYPLRLNDFTNTEWAMGFCFIINKTFVNKINLEFDEKLLSYAYAEDLDFTYRLWRAAIKNNYICIYDPNIKVRHLVSNEYRIQSLKHLKMYVYHRYYISFKIFKSNLKLLAIFFSDLPLFLNILKKDNQILFKVHLSAIIKINKIKKGTFNY